MFKALVCLIIAYISIIIIYGIIDMVEDKKAKQKQYEIGKYLNNKSVDKEEEIEIL